jgi:N-acetylglucosaminyldiphosphoundecaprenol N-acetyl-beta-D-mannosaminyltransferase
MKWRMNSSRAKSDNGGQDLRLSGGLDRLESMTTASLLPAAHEHVDILGVKVSAINLKSGVDLAMEWIEAGKPGYVCVTGVHGLVEAQRNPEFRRILNGSVINTPDGMPLTWIGRLEGFQQMNRVFGPDFMNALCAQAAERGYRNFFYGGQPGVVDHLCRVLKTRFPLLEVVGSYTPPFRKLNAKEERDLVDQVSHSKPDILWVGLSTPKQEEFMAQFVGQLRVPLLIGVGAAFDFHTGRIRDASNWVKRAGLQWLHRFMQEPRRLWKRYLVNNTIFLWLMLWHYCVLKQHKPEVEENEWELRCHETATAPLEKINRGRDRFHFARNDPT